MTKYLYSLKWQQQARVRAMAEVVSCWQLTAQAGASINLTAAYARFVMERVTLGQIFAWMLQFFAVNIVSPLLSAHSSVPDTV